MAKERNDLGYHWRRNAGVYDAPTRPEAKAPVEEPLVEEDEPVEVEEPVEDETPVEAEKPAPTPPSDPNTLWAPKPAKKTK